MTVGIERDHQFELRLDTTCVATARLRLVAIPNRRCPPQCVALAHVVRGSIAELTVGTLE